MKNIVIENLLIGCTPDGIAETSDNLPEATYIYLWNDIVKDGEGEMDLVKLWDTIPVVHQDNIIDAVAFLEEMKKNDFDNNNSVGMYKILKRDVWDDSVTNEIEGYMLKIKNNGIESRETFEAEDAAYNRHYDHVVSLQENIKPSSSPSRKLK